MSEIFFILPGRATTPVGGYKVVYEYANRLAADGYRVTLVSPAMLPLAKVSLWKKFRGLFRYIRIGICRKYRCRSWFTLRNGVHEKWVYRLHDRMFRNKAVVFATACETAYFLQRDSLAHLDRYYLIQHYENWVDQAILDSTWRSPLKKIVIADWLADIAHDYHTDCTLIENGLDFTDFRITVPIKEKDRNSVTMLWHKSEDKGSIDGLNALLEVKKQNPNLTALFFGIPDRPDCLPNWIQYYKNPPHGTLLDIYNRSSVFVAPSRAEGFGLTAAEAMQCGCAVAATNAGGFLQFCKKNYTALVSPANDSSALAGNILLLLNDNELRMRIANTGNIGIQNFTWNRAYKKMKQLIEETV